MTNTALNQYSFESILIHSQETDYYRRLHCPPDAIASEIEDYYRSRVAVLDSDPRSSSPEAQQAKLRLNEAFACLSDPLQRKRYNEILFFGVGDLKTKVFAFENTAPEQSDLSCIRSALEGGRIEEAAELANDSDCSSRAIRSELSSFLNSLLLEVLDDRYQVSQDARKGIDTLSDTLGRLRFLELVDSSVLLTLEICLEKVARSQAWGMLSWIQQNFSLPELTYISSAEKVIDDILCKVAQTTSISEIEVGITHIQDIQTSFGHIVKPMVIEICELAPNAEFVTVFDCLLKDSPNSKEYARSVAAAKWLFDQGLLESEEAIRIFVKLRESGELHPVVSNLFELNRHLVPRDVVREVSASLRAALHSTDLMEKIQLLKTLFEHCPVKKNFSRGLDDREIESTAESLFVKLLVTDCSNLPKKTVDKLASVLEKMLTSELINPEFKDQTLQRVALRSQIDSRILAAFGLKPDFCTQTVKAEFDKATAVGHVSDFIAELSFAEPLYRCELIASNLLRKSASAAFKLNLAAGNITTAVALFKFFDLREYKNEAKPILQELLAQSFDPGEVFSAGYKFGISFEIMRDMGRKQLVDSFRSGHLIKAISLALRTRKSDLGIDY